MLRLYYCILTQWCCVESLVRICLSMSACDKLATCSRQNPTWRVNGWIIHGANCIIKLSFNTIHLLLMNTKRILKTLNELLTLVFLSKLVVHMPIHMPFLWAFQWPYLICFYAINSSFFFRKRKCSCSVKGTKWQIKQNYQMYTALNLVIILD